MLVQHTWQVHTSQAPLGGGRNAHRSAALSRLLSGRVPLSVGSVTEGAFNLLPATGWFRPAESGKNWHSQSLVVICVFSVRWAPFPSPPTWAGPNFSGPSRFELELVETSLNWFFEVSYFGDFWDEFIVFCRLRWPMFLSLFR